MAETSAAMSISDLDLEKGAVDGADESDRSVCFSDADDRSWHSPYAGEEVRLSGASDAAGVEVYCRDSCVSDCSSSSLEVVVDDLVDSTAAKVAAGAGEVAGDEKDCRICHLSLEGTPESGAPIELGCSCKHDLAAAHKQCAETWFKIKGNKICEICGSTAKNVVCAATTEAELVEQFNESNANVAPAAPNETTRGFWRGHRFLNFLLACMVFAFVISWLFHFNVPG